MKVGLIGCGSIGSYLACNLGKELVWAVDSDEKARKGILTQGVKCKVLREIPEKCGGADLVVEAASQGAVGLLEGCLAYSDAMVLSVGALADGGLLKRLIAVAKKNGRKIYVPSGAIGGLDAVGAVASCSSAVILESTKLPQSLGRGDKTRTVVFEGNAKDAVRLFPKNMNVSAALALAGAGFEGTMVRVISDPAADKNVHRITVESEAGRMRFEFENVPSEVNPGTSKLAAMAVLEKIRKLGRELQVG